MNELAKMNGEGGARGESDKSTSSERWETTLEGIEFAGKDVAAERETQREATGEENKAQEAARLAVLEVLRPGQSGQEQGKPVGEMEPGDAIDEYLGLLRELSANFTEVEATQNVGPQRNPRNLQDWGGRFVKELYQKAGREATEESLDDAGMLMLADKILEGEQVWRGAGERSKRDQAAVTTAEAELAKLEAEQKGKGLLARLASGGEYRKKRKELQATIQQAKADAARAEQQSRQGNMMLGKALAVAYAEDYREDAAREQSSVVAKREEQERLNTEYNGKFTDGARQAKIDRAIELRKALFPTATAINNVAKPLVLARDETGKVVNGGLD